VDNSVRTANYLAVMQARRFELRDTLAQILPVHSHFVWEIGCGHGHFLTAYAQAHPADLCVGIDLVSERIGRAILKRDRAKLGNLHFLQADARLFMETLPPGSVFSRLFVLFPDPWPKLRHHKHRIMQMDFLRAVAQRTVEGTRLYFRTDYEPYFKDALSAIQTHQDWSISDDPWLFEHETVFQSRAPSFHSFVAKPHVPPP
jgi:tRNA (guanine-N7-)-methyltransferase